jgi:hypothetical protein
MPTRHQFTRAHPGHFCCTRKNKCRKENCRLLARRASTARIQQPKRWRTKMDKNHQLSISKHGSLHHLRRLLLLAQCSRPAHRPVLCRSAVPQNHTHLLVQPLTTSSFTTTIGNLLRPITTTPAQTLCRLFLAAI